MTGKSNPRAALYLPENRKKELKAYLDFVNDPEEIFKNSDYITVHVPINEETKDYIGKKEIEIIEDKEIGDFIKIQKDIDKISASVESFKM